MEINFIGWQSYLSLKINANFTGYNRMYPALANNITVRITVRFLDVCGNGP